MNNLPDPKVQKKIYDLIVKNPGLYLSKIAELLDMKISLVEYYLLLMEKDKILTVVKETDFERYYVEQKKVGIQDTRVADIREKIYDIISKNPGLHLSKIAEMLNMRTSLAEYHLNHLEKNNRIIAVKEGGYYKRYYTEESEVIDKEKKIIALLRQEIPLKIVLFLLKNPNAKYKEIQEHLDMSAPRLSYHLNKLAKNGMINVPTIDVKGYSLKNKKEIVKFLKKYKLYTVTENFKDMWTQLDYYDRDGSFSKKPPSMFFGELKPS